MADYGRPPPDWVVAPNEGWVAPRGRTPDGRVLATQGRRVLAFLIDYGIWVVPQMLVVGALLVVVLSSLDESGNTSGPNIAAMLLLYLVIFAIGILRLCVEAEKVARRGQTWGMQAMHLRVVDARNGAAVTRGRAGGGPPSPCGSALSSSASGSGGPSSTTATAASTTSSAPPW